MSAAFPSPSPKGAPAYQPRASPWDQSHPHSRVLTERRIPSVGQPMPDPRLCAVPSERMNHMIPISGVLPRAGMRGPVGAKMWCPKGASAYQPRATPWNQCHPHSRVLTERRIPSAGQPMPDPHLCAVPSERMNHMIPISGVLPRAGMRGPVGAKMWCPKGASAYQPRWGINLHNY